jgi:hypothetical protein
VHRQDRHTVERSTAAERPAEARVRPVLTTNFPRQMDDLRLAGTLPCRAARRRRRRDPGPAPRMAARRDRGADSDATRSARSTRRRAPSVIPAAASFHLQGKAPSPFEPGQASARRGQRRPRSR